MIDIDKEFNLLSEYTKIRIQLLPYVNELGGKRIGINYLPTFEYFKKNYNSKAYSLVKMNYKDSKDIKNSKIVNNNTKGLGTSDGIGHRLYNYWMGCKYYHPNNIEGNYNIDTNKINNIIK